MGFSKLWQEFKAFAFKGNMIDLAVAVVIGTAFGAVINSLVQDVMMPGITYLTTSAQTAVTTVAHVATDAVGVTSKPAETQPSETQPVPPPPKPTPPPAPAPAPAPGPAKPVELTWMIGPIKIGNFIGSLINFFLVAACVFLVIVKMLGSVMKKVGGTPQPSEPTTKECPFCLSIIPIKARKCAQCTADLPVSTTVAPPPA